MGESTLIISAASAIGKQLCAALAAKGHRVIASDRMETLPAWNMGNVLEAMAEVGTRRICFTDSIGFFGESSSLCGATARWMARQDGKALNAKQDGKALNAKQASEKWNIGAAELDKIWREAEKCKSFATLAAWRSERKTSAHALRRAQRISQRNAASSGKALRRAGRLFRPSPHRTQQAKNRRRH